MGESMDILKVRKIYDSMLDEKSKEIFLNRLLFNISNDSKYILNILNILNLVDKEAADRKLKKFEQIGKKIFIFGAGSYGQSIVKYYSNIKWEGFIDNNKKDNEILGIKVVDFDEFENNYLDSIVVISSPNYYDEMCLQLVNAGFNRENIITLKEYSYFSNQYFEMSPNEKDKESFVDAGALNGNTSKKFINWCKGNYSNIWAFEPDITSFEKCKNELKYPDVTVYSAGVFGKDGTINFNLTATGGSCIDKNAINTINTVKLDNVIRNEKVTFIKMDIEGAELDALKGAENILRTQKPKLAICVYHKPEDIIEIPNLLLKYNPDYKFKLSHYSYCEYETVLYAF